MLEFKKINYYRGAKKLKKRNNNGAQTSQLLKPRNRTGENSEFKINKKLVLLFHLAMNALHVTCKWSGLHDAEPIQIVLVSKLIVKFGWLSVEKYRLY